MVLNLATQKIFQKNFQILEAWKPTKDMKIDMTFYLWTQYNKNCLGHLIGTFSN